MKKLDVIFSVGELEEDDQKAIWKGFAQDSKKKSAP